MSSAQPLTASSFCQLFPAVSIAPLQERQMEAAQAHLDNLTKPRGSLGRLEALACRLYAMADGRRPLTVSPALMLTVAADHGVAAQGVSPYPSAVTRQMVANFCAGGAAINVLCRQQGMDLRVVDAGCAGGPFPPHEMLLDLRLGEGTADLSCGPAMSRHCCLRALRQGVALAQEAAGQGYACIGTGEMGIGNSTAATALYCALLDMRPEDVAGGGAGADASMLEHKIAIIHKALAVNAQAVRSADPVAILAALGGFEIATLCGIMLGGAACRLPVLVDGFICSAAYVAACFLCPHVADYTILAHASADSGHGRALDRAAALALLSCNGRESERRQPLLHLGLRLGEGTGGALAYGLLRAAVAVFNDMATFATAGVEDKTV